MRSCSRERYGDSARFVRRVSSIYLKVFARYSAEYRYASRSRASHAPPTETRDQRSASLFAARALMALISPTAGATFCCCVRRSYVPFCIATLCPM